MKKYVIHDGFVEKNNKKVYISHARLCILYKIPYSKRTNVVYFYKRCAEYDDQENIHLFPRNDENYPVFEEIEVQ